MSNLTAEQKREFLGLHYQDAYRMAESMHISLIEEDVRENIALSALEVAIETFDPSKSTKFTSYLFVVIRRRLFDAHEKAKLALKAGRGLSERVNFANEANNDDKSDEESNNNVGFSSSVAGTIAAENSEGTYLELNTNGIDEEELKESNERLSKLNAGLKKNLTERQWNILQMLVSPEETFDIYEQKHENAKGFKHCNYEVIAELLGISNPTVTREVAIIRKVTAKLEKSL